ncbi:cholest-4-en-3-one 26-monooxygenase [Catenulispora sp. MAP12-49]|jgi:cholest-4-en-3-one 26-monooxygenase|uniref:cytochrome P450 n=1 Tax=Catenulispora sp. MAP12-49 TaxID=3156302 RepID=UPI003514299D
MSVSTKPAIPVNRDFTDPDLYEERMPFEEFAELRRTARLWWCATPDSQQPFGDDGYWVASRHADVKYVSTHPELFASSPNTALVRFGPRVTREDLDMQKVIMLNADAPDHTKMRNIVQRGFTPRSINALESVLKERTRRIVAEAVERGSGNFVTDLASELPLQAIADLIGVPQEDRWKLFEWSNTMTGYDDPDLNVSEEDGKNASIELLVYAMGLAAQRREHPEDDIVTKLIQADRGDGFGKLNDDEFGFFVMMLVVAGNETTRNAITHGMRAFFDNPAQWELYKKERPKTAADEIVRWATPIISFQRTAAADTLLGDVEVKAGQRVVMLYSSANYDETVIAAPHTFDITRDPNPHLGFGGGGPHYCLGANLAKMEINLMFEALADLAPGLAPDGDVRRLRSAWINGIKALPVRYA